MAADVTEGGQNHKTARRPVFTMGTQESEICILRPSVSDVYI